MRDAVLGIAVLGVAISNNLHSSFEDCISKFHGIGYAPQEYAVLQISFEDIKMHI